MKKLPVVALVGQTNAGKSSLLNRMAHRNIAIVAREEGTTRDNVMARIDDRFVLVDTAGLKDPTDDFEASIQEQIADAIDSADMICVVLDATKYPDFRDKDIAKRALKSRKPVLLVLNKCDLAEALPAHEFLSLGIKPEQTCTVSATTGAGVKELKRQVAALTFSGSEGLEFSERHTLASRENRPAGEPLGVGRNIRPENSNLEVAGANDPEKANAATRPRPITLALIGRPNVGKSSLFNSLGRKQQAIVSSRQGTTRDVNRVEVRYKGRDLEILDTAGLRKPGKREVGIEKFSAIRTLAAIEEADVCALLVDATEPHSKLDQTLAGQIVEAGKGIIVVVTKTDLLSSPSADSSSPLASPSSRVSRSAAASEPRRTCSQNLTADELLNSLERDFNFLPYAPVVLTSSETGANVTQLFELALQIDAARRTEVKTSELNKILGDAIVAHAPAGLKNTRPKPKYIVQTDVCPPWFVVHGHDLGLLHWSWKRYLERKIREKYPFVGTPIMFSYRDE